MCIFAFILETASIFCNLIITLFHNSVNHLSRIKNRRTFYRINEWIDYIWLLLYYTKCSLVVRSQLRRAFSRAIKRKIMWWNPINKLWKKNKDAHRERVAGSYERTYGWWHTGKRIASFAKNVSFFFSVRFSVVKRCQHTRRKWIVTFNQREELWGTTHDDLLRSQHHARYFEFRPRSNVYFFCSLLAHTYKM